MVELLIQGQVVRPHSRDALARILFTGYSGRIITICARRRAAWDRIYTGPTDDLDITRLWSLVEPKTVSFPYLSKAFPS